MVRVYGKSLPVCVYVYVCMYYDGTWLGSMARAFLAVYICVYLFVVCIVSMCLMYYDGTWYGSITRAFLCVYIYMCVCVCMYVL